MEPTDHPIRAAAARVLTVVVVAMVGVAIGLVALSVIAPQEDGMLALGQIVQPHIVLLALVVATIAVIALRTRVVTLALIVLVVVALARFGSDWISLPAGPAPGEQVELLSWNMEIGSRPAAEAAAPILAHDADVVALQELTPDVAAALDTDPRIMARYPHRLLMPDPIVMGLGILSAHPITHQAMFGAPIGLAVTLDLGSGRILTVMDTHPMHAEIGLEEGRPLAYDARVRDRDLATVHTRAEALGQAGSPFVVIGDFNTTPTEPGYAVLTQGLRDIHVEVGMGPGWTWRPSRLESIHLGLFRIDMALAGAGVEPVSSSVDCSYPGDHCMLQVTVAIP